MNSDVTTAGGASGAVIRVSLVGPLGVNDMVLLLDGCDQVAWE